MSGAHSRRMPAPFREATTAAPSVATTTSGLAIEAVPSGTSPNRSTATVITEMANQHERECRRRQA